jgi:hypothetical protein
VRNCPTCGHEVLDPEPAEGVVVIDRDDDAWQHRPDGGWSCTESGSDYRYVTWKYLNEEHGPIKIVYDPQH